MFATPQKPRHKPSPAIPQTPGSAAPRRSPRWSAAAPKCGQSPASTPVKAAGDGLESPRLPQRCKRSLLGSEKTPSKCPAFSPLTPNPPESKRRRRSGPALETKSRVSRTPKKPKSRIYYKKVVYDGGEFMVGDDVYVKRRDGAESDAEDPEVEECRICFMTGTAVMIECDDCLLGFHLRCLKPPLRKVPEGDWVCGFCEARKLGKEVELPKPPEGKKVSRTAKEKLLASDLWAARIER